MMFLYAALTALLCISFSSGANTPLLPEIEETTQTSETTQTLEIQASEIEILETTQTLEIEILGTTQTETTPTVTTPTVTTPTVTTPTVTTPTVTTPTVTTPTVTTPTVTTPTVTTPTVTTPTVTTPTVTTQTLETTQPPTVLIQKSGRPCTSSGRASDVTEIGCWGYKRCVEGEAVTYWCTQNTVLERDSMTCVRPETGKTGCNGAVSCTDKQSGLYANMGSKCQTYYWCHGGVNFAHIYCPATLVFNEKEQTCDYPYNVEAPCGTKVLQ